MKFKSKVDELLEKLMAEGKVTQLPDEEVAAMNERIGAEMRLLRRKLRYKEAQSWRDTSNIVLTD